MATYSKIPNPVYIQFTLYPNMATSIPTHFIILNYVHTYVPLYIFKVFSLHNILNYSTCTMSGQFLLCSSVLRTCTWKIVFKIQNNELNELSECMLLQKVLIFRKTPQNCKTFFYNIFQKLYLLTLLCLL